MKIIHYSSSLCQSAGGLYYSVSGLAKAQKMLGADVRVVGGIDVTFPQDRAIWADVPLDTFVRRDEGGYTFSPRIAALLVAARPDILHIHGIWSETAIYGRIAAMLGIATVCSPRGMLDPWIVNRRRFVKAVHASLFERPFLRRSAVHALNSSEAKSVAAFFAPRHVPTFIVPNGVDLPDRPPADGRSGTLYLGRLHEKKQVIELVHNWQAQPALDLVMLTIAGWGDPEYEKQLMRTCEQTSNVRFVGRAYGETKADLLSQHQWFILPSLSEGLPMAVLEAMAAGCIPLITRECNLPELVDQGSAIGIKSDFSDFGAAARLMAEATTAEANALQAKSLDAVQAFGWPSIAQRVLDGYEAFLAKCGR